ncbi:MAG: [Muribaculaceae bacterium]|nr:[citrate (pro-3S)-lyase] ligase [Muribaculaceae bacterium]MBQ7205026.1 [citrate (pro-3S)-lyase] ligase [Muribaculaceae bacterium]
MYDNFEICDMPLSLKSNRTRVERFLADSGLRLEDVDYYAAVTDDDGNIIAGGGLQGNVIKCIAVGEAARDTGMSNKLISHLVAMANQQGADTVKVYTKPENRTVFESMAFKVIAAAPCAILMENGMRGIGRYTDYLRRVRGDRPDGAAAIVMNANPFTLGHRYLVEQAASTASTLYVIAVREDRSVFSYAERLAMIQAGCRGLDNVVVVEGSDYAISELTFPTYFLKQVTDATDTHITLDLDLFARHIAPALGVKTRYVGSEPIDELTARYNQLMQQLLPQQGIEVKTVERLTKDGQPVSASRLRQALADGILKQAAELVPATTVPFLIAHLATDALRTELNTTPKPGLVDRNDNGAHQDMDLVLMNRSIDALQPYFDKLALLGGSDEMPATETVRRIGIDAEHSMLNATGGVNTHRGALFSMGLAALAGAWCMAHDGTTDEKQLRDLMMQVAAGFAPTAGTHGNDAVNAHRVTGALDLAKAGYPQLFSNWLPAYRGYLAEDATTACHRLLLLIMSQLDDTNVIHRVGFEQAQQVKHEAQVLLDSYSTQGMAAMNRDFIARNVSPGGSADMVALTLFIHALLN